MPGIALGEGKVMIDNTAPDEGCRCTLIDESGAVDAPSAQISSSICNRWNVRRILVALGGAPVGESKLPVAEMFARAFGADILFLHVLTRAAAQVGDPVTPEEARATAYLETVSARLHADGAHAHGLVRPATSVADGIVAVAQEQSVDLIVLGLDVRGRVSRAFRQNVADEVARRTSSPVVIVQPDHSARRAPAVRSFDEDAGRWGPLARWELGVRPVSIARIVGSVGRANELQVGGNPGGSRLGHDSRRQRYNSILAAMRSGAALPAVELYKLGSGYYVLDGNHRIAAARELGQTEIDADVSEFVPLDDATAQRVFAERRVFERATGLIDVDSAHYPGTYSCLLGLVEAYVSEHAFADPHEGARRWYHRVYQPLVQAIHRRGLPHRYHGKQVADLAAWVIDFAAEQFPCGETADWDLVTARLLESVSPSALPLAHDSSDAADLVGRASA
jgi:nucleotide-binding universal stress UspA family protein